MSRTFVQFNDYVSLAVMLLMLIAFIGSRSGATELAAGVVPTGLGAAAVTAPLALEIDAAIGDQALKIGLAVVGELSQFRGEDE